MDKILFVGWLFISGIACLVIAAASSSLGWLVGGGVFFSVAMIALRQLKKEQETKPAPASGRFVIVAITVMLLIMGGLFWLQFSA